MLFKSDHGSTAFILFLVLQGWVDTGGLSNTPLVLNGDWVTEYI